MANENNTNKITKLTAEDKQLLKNLESNVHFGKASEVENPYDSYFDHATPGFGRADESHQVEDLQHMAYILMNVSNGSLKQTDRVISSYPYYQQVYSKHKSDILARAAKGYEKYFKDVKQSEKEADEIAAKIDANGNTHWTWPAKRTPRSIKELEKELGEVHDLWVASHPKRPIMPDYMIAEGLPHYVRFALPVADPQNQELIDRLPLYYFNPSEHIYQANERTIKEFIESLAPELISRSKILDVLDALRTRTSKNNVVQLTQAKHLELVAVNNGVFNWANKKFRPFNDATDVFDAKIGTNYNPKATKEPLFGKEKWGPLKFIKQISVDEETGQYDPKKFNLIMQGFFDAVARVYWHRKMLLLVSKSRTGKSTLVNIMRSTMGTQANYSTLTPDQFDNPLQMAELINKTAIIGDDMNIGHKIKNDKNFKNLFSPNGVVDARALYHRPYHIQPRLFCIATSNGRIQFANGNEADYDRIITVHLTKQFQPGKNDDPKVIRDYSVSRKTAEFMLNWLLNHMADKPFLLPDESKRYDKEYASEDNPFIDFKNNVQNQISSPVVPVKYMYMLYKANAMANNYPQNTIFTKNEFIRHMKDEVPSWQYKHKAVVFRSKQSLAQSNKEVNWNLKDVALFDDTRNGIARSRQLDYDANDINGRTFYSVFMRVYHAPIKPAGKKELSQKLESIARYANQQLPSGMSITSKQLQQLLCGQTKQAEQAANIANKTADNLSQESPQNAKAIQENPDITLSRAIKACESDPLASDPDQAKKDELAWHEKHDPLDSNWLLVNPWLSRDMTWTDKNNRKHSLGNILTFETLVRQMTDYQKKYQLQTPIIKSTEFSCLFLLDSRYIDRATHDWDPSNLITVKKQSKKAKQPTIGQLNDRQRDALELTHQIQNKPTTEQKQQLSRIKKQASDWQLISPILPGGLETKNWQIDDSNKFNGLKQLNSWFINHNAYKDKCSFMAYADNIGDVVWFSKELFDRACDNYKQQTKNKDLLQ